MVSDGTKVSVADVEKLFDEARKTTKFNYEKWAKYYNRSRYGSVDEEEMIPIAHGVSQLSDALGFRD
ncbi:hypothetical protein TNCV_126421 [Trichonephila clavipes]|nr:hypothetical protein TNCV_126421 [Trichonephila clavipes]